MQVAWNQTEQKIRDMISYDFNGLGQEVVEKLEKDMRKWVVAHKSLGEETYVYFVGLGQVDTCFDARIHRQVCWVSKREVAAMIRDNRHMKGAVPISTRIVAKALKEQLFERDDCRITVLGTVQLQT